MKRGSRTKRTENEALASRLVKLELDVAEALAEFSRIAHFRRQDKSGGESQASLQWSGKRKRSARLSNIQAGPVCMEEREATFMSSKAPKIVFDENKFLYACKGAFPTAEGDEFSKECSFRTGSPSKSRAESPSSPLPSLQVNCRTFLLGASAAKSAFQRELPMRPFQPFPVHIKIEDGCMDVNHVPAAQVYRVTAKKKPRVHRPPVSVEVGKSGEQEVDTKEPNDTGCQSLIAAGLELKPSISSALEWVDGSRQAGLRFVSKPKAALTEMEREARRLRRVQANRESARQTIRRKQILFEELTKRTANLALENESMKQKKGLLMQELYSLKNWNHHLKQQLTIEPSGHESFHQSSSMPLQTASIPASQVPRLPPSGVPVPSFAWDLSIAEVNIGNQTPMLHSGATMLGGDCTVGGFTNYMSHSAGVNKKQQSSICVPFQSSDTCVRNQVPTSCAAQQKTACNSKDSCPSRTSAQKETGSVAAERDPSVKLEMLDYDRNSAITNAKPGSESVIGAGVCGNAVCQPSAHARGSSFQLAAAFPALSFTSKSAVNDAPGTSKAASGSLNHCFDGVPAQLSWAFSSCGGSPQTCVFVGRKTSAAIAAAEARRRRKELTRSKFSQSRAFRLHC